MEKNGREENDMKEMYCIYKHKCLFGSYCENLRQTRGTTLKFCLWDQNQSLLQASLYLIIRKGSNGSWVQ